LNIKINKIAIRAPYDSFVSSNFPAYGQRSDDITANGPGPKSWCDVARAEILQYTQLAVPSKMCAFFFFSTEGVTFLSWYCNQLDVTAIIIAIVGPLKLSIITGLELDCRGGKTKLENITGLELDCRVGKIKLENITEIEFEF